jgi:hypothetical protein
VKSGSGKKKIFYRYQEAGIAERFLRIRQRETQNLAFLLWGLKREVLGGGRGIEHVTYKQVTAEKMLRISPDFSP